MCQQQQYMENSQVFAKYREPDYASQYSPWSCDTIGSYIGSKEGKSKDSMERMVSHQSISNLILFSVCCGVKLDHFLKIQI